MSGHDANRILKPTFFAIKHLRQGRGKRRPYVIGFDSEAHSCDSIGHEPCAENGFPFLYQFAHPSGACDLVDVPRTARRYETFFVFVRYLWDHCKDKSKEFLVFGYNLEYEYTQLFRDLDPELMAAGEFRLGDKASGEPCILPDAGVPFYVTATNQKRFTLTIEWAHTKRRVRVLDAMAFLPGGLDNAAKMIGIGRKADRPATFDRSAARSPEFVRYASQDAILTQGLGEWIIDLHERYDVTMAISAPHFASKVYKRAFLRDEIPQAHAEIEQDGLRSYHGGKNGFYLDRPSLLPDMWHVDIRSAYPEAMRQLPDPESADWTFTSGYTHGLHALWRVRGWYTRCLYRSLMHDTGWPDTGLVDLVCTGYELDSALSRGEIQLSSCEGWSMVGPAGGSLVEYVDTFFALKSTAKSTTEKVAAKLFLNSLYGKFFQKVAQGEVGSVDLDSGRIIVTDPTQDYDYVAGGLYHPPIASLITGYVRAKIHGLEHLLGSVMTSTDGMFSPAPPPATMIGKGLGMLSAEKGTLRILRERAYVFDPDEPEHANDCQPACADPHPVYALHGYQGTLAELRAVSLTPGLTHRYTSRPKPVLLRESLRLIDGQRHRPGEFVRSTRSFQLPGTNPLDTGPTVWEDS